MTANDLSGLLASHGAALTLYARQFCDCPEDVVQEAFLRLFGQGRSPDDPAAWLFRAVRNAAIDAARINGRRRRREGAVARSESWFAEPTVDGLDAVAAVEALRGLPLEQREVIVAHLWGGRPFEQIGEWLGCSASTAHRRYSAGLSALRQRLGVTPCPNETT